MGLSALALVQKVTVDQLVDRIQQCIANASKLTISSVGFHAANTIAARPATERVFRALDIVLADGIAMIWASRILDRPLEYEHRIGGDILAARLYPVAARHGWGIFCLGGGTLETVSEAAGKLRAAYPDLRVAGAHPWYPSSEAEDSRVVDLINRSGATIVLVGMGQPRQEEWIVANRDRASAAVFIAVGGYFEHVVRNVDCYPAWVYRWHFNWGYRLLREPRRLWKRYSFGMLRFAGHVLSERVRAGRRT